MKNLQVSEIYKMVQNTEIKPNAAMRIIRALSEQENEGSREPIAVIGMSGQFPLADSVDEFWDNLRNAKDCISEVPGNRWDLDGFYHPDPRVPDRSYSKWGGFLNNYDRFDPLFFHISPKEAELMEPGQRLFLMEAWKALEDAGYTRERVDGIKCGVFVGYGGGDYTSVIRDSGCNAESYQFMGNAGSILASRISYYLNLKGPAVALDTACSSSLVALHQACNSIFEGSSDIAIVGGVMVFSTGDYYIMSSQTNMLSPTGKCSTFDESADGFVPGEACAAVVLKRCSQAIKDNDHIYGLIVGSDINQDGKTNGITAPSSSSQQQLINSVYDRFHIDPETIGYVEAHGTGTMLGDPIEIFALTDAYRKYTGKKQYCAIGSVKSNIGHTLVASGVCSLIKTLLCISRHELVPSIHYHKTNPKIDFAASPFYVNTVDREWEEKEGQPLRAAISAFGFSGTNCHLVAEEYVDQRQYVHREKERYILPISAHDQRLLGKICEKYVSFLRRNPGIQLADFAYSVSCTRQQHRERIVIAVRNMEELRQALDDYINDRKNDHILTQENFEGGETQEDKLVASYLQGKNCHWGELYQDGVYKKLHLPCYEFLLERYWIGDKSDHTEQIRGKNQTIRFSRKDYFIRDHVVNGECVVPGVALLAAAQTCATRAFSKKWNLIQNMTWLKVIRVREDLQYTVVFKENADSISAEICELNQDGVGDCAAKCELISADEPEEEFIDIEGMTGGLIRLDKQQCYDSFGKVGFSYGSSFQVINEMYLGEEYMVGHLCMSEENQNDFYLEPALLDGALQAVIAFKSYRNPELKEAYIPFCLKNFQIKGKLGRECYVYATETSEEAENSCFHILICDVDGRIVIEIEDFFALRLKGDETQAAQKMNVGETGGHVAYYMRKWTETPVAEPLDSVRTAVVYQGTIPDWNADNVDSCFELDSFENMTDFGDHNFLTVAVSESLFDDRGMMTEQFYRFFRSLICGGKARQFKKIAFIGEGLSDEAKLWALDSFVKALMLENEWFNAVVIQYEDDTCELPGMLKNEVAQTDQSVKYMNGKRYILTTEPADIIEEKTPIREGGSYIVSGGTGKLGYEVAAYIAKKKGNLIILGRKSEEHIRNRLDELRKYGVTVSYYAGDIAEEEFVRNALLQKIPGEIYGVVHCAGSIRDKEFSGKRYEEYYETCAAKILGIRNLHNYTRDLPLDFFVAFSAMACIWGNTGQTDYCYANAYMDAFAKERNRERMRGACRGKSISINWPLWEEGNMRLGSRVQNLLFEQYGMIPLQTEAGVKAFDEILNSDAEQVIIYCGIRNRSIMKENRKEVEMTDFNEMERFIRQQICQILKIPEEYISKESDFGTFGFDSIAYTDLAEILNRKYSMRLTPAIFFEYHTIESLMDYIKREFPEAGPASAPEKVSAGQSEIQPKYRTVIKKSPEKKKNALRGSDGEAEIAVIGMAGVMPGCDSIDEFWEAILGGKDLVSEIPKERWDWRAYYGDPKYESNKTHSRWGAFMKNIDCFDAEFFGISPKEAQVMDPQQRLFLQIVWNAVEDAGYNADDWSGKKIAVFAGSSTSDYQELLREEKADVEAFSALGVTHSVIANRVSYFMNWSGESSPVDTACSSALVAIHRAVKTLQNGESEIAVAGGINCILSPSIYLSFDKAGMLSADGKSHVFDKQANGYVRGEGGGALILKPLAKAMEDHDHIYAVIKGSSVNHCGKTNSLSSPNPNAQAEVISDAIRQAGISVDSIDYIETHGTGTPIGDPIEINGLKKAFRELHGKMEPGTCGLGSVKSNIGHLEAASGIASVFKVLLSMKNNILPPSIHFHDLNPYIDFNESPFYVVDHATEWRKKKNNEPKRAGVSSFGFSGVNAHVVLEEYDNFREEMREQKNYFFVLSARNEKALAEYAGRMITFLEKEENKYLSACDIAYTSQIGRKAFRQRLAVVFRDTESLRVALSDFAAGIKNDRVFRNEAGQENKLLRELFSNQLGKEFLGKIMESQNAEMIGKLWAGGFDIDWNILYEDHRPYRVALPGYPFEKKHYWMKKGNKEKRSEMHAEGKKEGQENYSVSHILHKEDWCLSEHSVKNRFILPGAIALQLVMNAIGEKHPKDFFEIEEIYWLSAVDVSDELKLVLRFQEEKDAVAFEITDDAELPSRMVFAKGKMRRQDASAFSVETYDVARMKQESRRIVRGCEHYNIAKEIGIEFGTHFRSVSNIYVKDQEALVELNREILEKWETGQRRYAAVDGAFQGVSGLYQSRLESPLLPFYVEKINIFSENEIGYALISRRKEDEYQIRLLEQNGRLAVLLDRVILKTAPATTAENSDSLFIPVWEKKDFPAESTEKPDNTAIVYMEDDSTAKKLAVYLECRNENVVDIKEPELIGKISDVKSILIVAVAESGDESRQSFDIEKMCILKIYRFLKQLSEAGMLRGNRSITVLTGNYMCIADEKTDISEGGIQGFLHSAAREFEGVRISCLDFEKSDLTDHAEEVAEAIKRTLKKTGYTVLCYRDHRFYEKKLYAVRLSNTASAFRMQGVYLVVGGAGGIGSELAKYLMRKYQAKIAIVGRRPELPAGLFSDEDLKYGEVFYVQADIGEEEEVRKAVSIIEQRFGMIHGVVHSALVLEDKSIDNMEADDMKKVLWPKANGSAALYKTLEGKSLDFMLFFTSVQSMIGMAGQSNYAAACDFKETFADYIAQRENWNVCSIHWGYWGETGVVAGKEYRRRMEAVGIQSITIQEGLRYIEQALGNHIRHLYVMKSTRDVKEKMNVCFDRIYQMTGAVVDKADCSFDNRRRIEEVIEDKTGYEKISGYAAKRLMTEFRKTGLFTEKDRYYSEIELKETVHLISKYEKLFEEILSILEKNQMIARRGDQFTVTFEGMKVYENLKKEGRELTAAYPETLAYIELIDACMDDYMNILCGNRTATEVMFPSANVNLVGNVYRGNRISDFYNENLAAWVESFLEKCFQNNRREKIRILEIGAGTGGTSVYIFKAIQKYADNISYVYSDVSESFVNYGKRMYAENYPFVEFRVVDMEQEVTEEFESYDLIVGTNVLHVSSDIGNNLRHIKARMKKNAALVFCEMVSKEDYITLTFGLLDGWWMFCDGENRIPGTPLFTQKGWRRILMREGFYGFTSYNRGDFEYMPQDIMIAYSDGVNPAKTEWGRLRPESSEPAEIKPVQKHNLDEDDIRKYVRDLIYESLERDMGVEKDHILETKAFRDYGIDSITGVKLIDTLNRELGIDMKTIVLFDNSNIAELVDYIAAEYSEDIIRRQPVCPSKRDLGSMKDEKDDRKSVPEEAELSVMELLNQLQAGEISIDYADEMLGDY